MTSSSPPAEAVAASSSLLVAGLPVAWSDVARRHPLATRGLTAVHRALLDATHGRLAARWFGAPIMPVETTGRRTGRRHAAPLVYLRDGEDLIVIAANGGADRPPAWWLNLRAAGEGVAVVAGRRRQVKLGVVEGARRDRLWKRFAAISAVEHYQDQTARRLPVVALTAGLSDARVGTFGRSNTHERPAAPAR